MRSGHRLRELAWARQPAVHSEPCRRSARRAQHVGSTRFERRLAIGRACFAPDAKACRPMRLGSLFPHLGPRAPCFFLAPIRPIFASVPTLSRFTNEDSIQHQRPAGRCLATALHGSTAQGPSASEAATCPGQYFARWRRRSKGRRPSAPQRCAHSAQVEPARRLCVAHLVVSTPTTGAGPDPGSNCDCAARFTGAVSPPS